MGKNVLLVEDDRNFQYLVERLTKRIDLISELRIANDGQEAIELFQAEDLSAAHAIDLLIVDINMPRLNGFEFLEQFKLLRANDEQIKKIEVVMLTSSNFDEDLKKAKALNIVREMFIKPTNIIELEKILKQAAT